MCVEKTKTVSNTTWILQYRNLVEGEIERDTKASYPQVEGQEMTQQAGRSSFLCGAGTGQIEWTQNLKSRDWWLSTQEPARKNLPCGGPIPNMMNSFPKRIGQNLEFLLKINMNLIFCESNNILEAFFYIIIIIIKSHLSHDSRAGVVVRHREQATVGSPWDQLPSQFKFGPEH